jgi:hypothetical protein
MRERIRPFQQHGGHIFERSVAEAFVAKGWTLILDQFLDEHQKVDFTVIAYRGRGLPFPIEVQVTLDGENHSKLFGFIRLQRNRKNGRIKVYLAVKNLASAADAANAAHALFRRDLFGKCAPNAILFLQVSERGEGQWLDIVEQERELWKRFKRNYNSPDRKRGTIERITCDRGSCVIKNGDRRYFAFYSEIADGLFAARLERGEVKIGTPVTFMPTKETSTGPYYLARCVLPAPA